MRTGLFTKRRKRYVTVHAPRRDKYLTAPLCQHPEDTRRSSGVRQEFTGNIFDHSICPIFFLLFLPAHNRRRKRASVLTVNAKYAERGRDARAHIDKRNAMRKRILRAGRRGRCFRRLRDLWAKWKGDRRFCLSTKRRKQKRFWHYTPVVNRQRWATYKQMMTRAFLVFLGISDRRAMRARVVRLRGRYETEKPNDGSRARE